MGAEAGEGGSWAYPHQQRQLQIVDSFVSPNRLPRASHRQHLILVCTRVPPKRLRTYTPSGQLQTTLQQDPISFTSSVSKGKSRMAPNSAEVNSHSCVQHLHGSSHTVDGVEPHSKLAQGSIPCTNRPTAITQLQQEDAHTPKDIPGAPSLGDQGDCTTGLYRPPTLLGHTTKTENHSSST